MTTAIAPQPSSAPPPSPPRAPRRRTGLTITAVVLGAGSTVVGLLGGGGLLAVDHSERDADGYFTTKTAHVVGTGYAVSSQRLDLTGADDVLSHVASKVRVSVKPTDGKPVFVGIGRDPTSTATSTASPAARSPTSTTTRR